MGICKTHLSPLWKKHKKSPYDASFLKKELIFPIRMGMQPFLDNTLYHVNRHAIPMSSVSRADTIAGSHQAMDDERYEQGKQGEQSAYHTKHETLY
ncbi:hypothetical protein ccbrp13_60800 [Ktedonobacteria bacterium brp13]|nr:hypothetical protein ccbrp13_60800 [Ktedonobacteria bacterium brp13]